MDRGERLIKPGDIVDFVTDPIASIATGLLGQKGASDRNEQQIA